MKKSAQTKQIIIKKSAEVFNQKGYDGTSMNDLMIATGLTKGALYGNFKNKDEIAESAFNFAVNQVWHEVSQRTKVIDNTSDKLKAVVYFYKERLFTPPIQGGCPILKTAVMSETIPKSIKKSVQIAIKNWQNSIIKTLEKGKIKGDIAHSVNSKEFATLFIAILEGGMLLARTYESYEPFNRICQHLISLIDDLKINS